MSDKNVDSSNLQLANELIGERTLSKLLEKGLVLPDPRPHLNIVFIGHVDAGKSTTCGYILVKTNKVDQRTLEKYEREAKENNRESWYYAYILDINEEEREKGKTTEVGRASFELTNRRYTILDAPGHKNFVPEMISGASQADVGVLIVSARKGEYESGFEKGGQTQEHALLAKTLGVTTLIVAVNKMDDPSVEWDEVRYRKIVENLSVFLKTCGYNVKTDVYFIPISGLKGTNIVENCANPASSSYTAKAVWYGADSPTLFDLFESVNLPSRKMDTALRIPLLSGYRDSGVLAVGKVESGVLVADTNAVIVPSNAKVKVLSVIVDDVEVTHALPGENVEVRLQNIEESQLVKGCVLCSAEAPARAVDKLKVQFVIVDCLENKQIFSAGYCAVLHIHTASEQFTILQLLETIDRTTKKVSAKPAFARSNQIVTAVIRLERSIAVEKFTDFPSLGRFTIRDEGKTIAIGKVLEMPKKKD